jgi:hypothetical protein
MESVVRVMRYVFGSSMNPTSHKRDRFPPELNQHAVWLHARFTLSFRDVEDMLAERGVDVSNETTRRWPVKFGFVIARNARWHLDEMAIKTRRLQRILHPTPFATTLVLQAIQGLDYCGLEQSCSVASAMAPSSFAVRRN